MSSKCYHTDGIYFRSGLVDFNKMMSKHIMHILPQHASVVEALNSIVSSPDFLIFRNSWYIKKKKKKKRQVWTVEKQFASLFPNTWCLD